MYDAESRVIGIRRRFKDGSKKTLSGTHLGLFKANYSYNANLPLLITEGESDCAAALSLGFQAIGRPNSNACRQIILGWLTKP